MLVMAMTLSLTGCQGSTSSSKPAGNIGNNTVQSVLEQQMKDAETLQLVVHRDWSLYLQVKRFILMIIQSCGKT